MRKLSSIKRILRYKIWKKYSTNTENTKALIKHHKSACKINHCTGTGKEYQCTDKRVLKYWSSKQK